eukprot:Trichotokara_eunicae@DN10234_c0_g1_i1.p1
MIDHVKVGVTLDTETHSTSCEKFESFWPIDSVLMQLALDASRHGVQHLTWPEKSFEDIASGTKKSENYIFAARELDVLTPKSPDDIFKSFLDDRVTPMDSWRANLAATLASAFCNMGFGTDALM